MLYLVEYECAIFVLYFLEEKIKSSTLTCGLKAKTHRPKATNL